jgi:ligand-binding sensor domain-containing protein
MYRYKRNKYFILFPLCILISCFNLFSQDYSYIRYDANDGLASSVVYDALQDNEGFMWFATESGLSRFDGKNFKTFTTRDGLPDNEILKLFFDNEGRLWIMPFKPALCYYYKGKIHNKDNDSLLAKIFLSTYAFDMAEDRSGNLFIAEMKAGYIIFKNGTVKTISKVKEANTSLSGLGINKSGEVEFFLSKFSIHTGVRHYLFNPLKEITDTIKEMSFSGDVSSLLINPDYLISPDNQNFQLSFYKEGNKFMSVKIPKNTTSLSYLDKDRFTINTMMGMQIFNIQTKRFSGRFFKDFSITSAFEDKEKNMWLTTQGSGILMVPSFKFRNYSLSENKKNPEITALCKKDNIVYAAGWEKKIWKININELSFSSFIPKQRFPERSKFISILAFNDKLILGNTGYYQNPFNPGKKVAISLKSVSLGKSGIIFASHLNTILCKWSGEENVIWEERSTCAVEKDSGFYIGTLNGLYHKSYAGEIVNLGNIFPFFASRIVNLAVSDEGILWVATKGNGVAAYVNDKLLFHFTEADGLTSDNCTSLYLDSSTVWLGTEKGLNRIEILENKNKITRFSMSDGLPSNMINAIAARGKKIFVGTPKGLTYFDADNISQTSVCDLQLTGIYITNKYSAYDSANFSLPHKDNDIRFEFSGISFKSAGDITYQYRLLGLQSEWRTTTEQQLSFPSLSSGQYSFQLKAINKYGVQSRIINVSFDVQKLLWEKTWFRLLMLFVFATIIWAFFRYRIRRVRLKEKEQTNLNQRIAELEQKTLRSQMNPHFIFNSLNSIQQYVVERDITGANNFITDFSKLIRMTLDLSANTIINMADEIDYITTYLRIEKMRLENQFDYFVNIDNTLDLKDIYLPPLLLQPYVENCIRHGVKYKKEEKGVIKISLRKKETGIMISIEDNGIGREAAQKYKSQFHIQYQSKGMNISKDRIDILNNYNDKKITIQITDLYDEDNKAKGTRVDLYLPD